MSEYIVGQQYSRADIYRQLGFDGKPAGDWLTGYHEEDGEIFVFAAVNATGRTGHDYANEGLSDGRFLWYGKNSSTVDHAQIQRLVGGELPVHIFWRGENRDPFTGLDSAFRTPS